MCRGERGHSCPVPFVFREREASVCTPLEVLVVAPMSACVQLPSLAYTQIGHARVSVCATKSDTKSDTNYEMASNERISVAHRNEASGGVRFLRVNVYIP
jgi:hypothetical protein